MSIQTFVQIKRNFMQYFSSYTPILAAHLRGLDASPFHVLILQQDESLDVSYKPTGNRRD